MKSLWQPSANGNSILQNALENQLPCKFWSEFKLLAPSPANLWIKTVNLHGFGFRLRKASHEWRGSVFGIAIALMFWGMRIDRRPRLIGFRQCRMAAALFCR